jgi:hypothetical protein
MKPLNSNPGKAAFKPNKQLLEAGNYTNNKNVHSFYCANKCPPINSVVKNQSEYLLLQKTRQLNNCSLPFNKNNLNVNLISKINLDNVCVLKNNCTNVCNTDGIRFCLPIYLNYGINSNNNNFCILNNNSENRVYYPPPSLL